VVWDAVKGHAGSLDMVFKYVRGGTPLAQAIETARHFTYKMLLAGLSKAPNRHRCEEELERLRKGDWLLKEKEPLLNPELRFLIENNILFVFEPAVVPQHEMMRWAIDMLLTEFPISPNNLTQ
jgi:hypothetical protein